MRIDNLLNTIKDKKMNEEKIKELLDMGFSIDEVIDTYDIIRDLAEVDMKKFLEDCFK